MLSIVEMGFRAAWRSSRWVIDRWGLSLEAVKCVQLLGPQSVGHPAVALSQDAQEEWPALVDQLEAEVEDAVLLRLLLGNSPPQVDVDQLDAARQQPLAQLGEDDLDEVIALRVHVAERRGDEDTGGLPRSGHDPFPRSNNTQELADLRCFSGQSFQAMMTGPRWLGQTAVDLGASAVLDQGHGNAEGQGHLALSGGDGAAAQAKKADLGPRNARGEQVGPVVNGLEW